MININKIINFFLNTNQEARKRISDIFSLLSVKIFFVISIFINILSWLTAGYIDSKIDDTQIPLHFNVDFGIDYYGNTKNIYIIPLLGLIFILFNVFLLHIVYPHKDRKFLSYLLLIGALMANLVLLNSILLIFLVIFR